MPIRIKNIAGIADRGLTDSAILAHTFHSDLHIRYPVQRIENPEHIHTTLNGLFDKGFDQVVGIVDITDHAG